MLCDMASLHAVPHAGSRSHASSVLSFGHPSLIAFPPPPPSHAGISFTELGRKLGEAWKALPEGDKAPFKAKEEADKARVQALNAPLMGAAAAQKDAAKAARKAAKHAAKAASKAALKALAASAAGGKGKGKGKVAASSAAAASGGAAKKKATGGKRRARADDDDGDSEGAGSGADDKIYYDDPRARAIERAHKDIAAGAVAPVVKNGVITGSKMGDEVCGVEWESGAGTVQVGVGPPLHHAWHTQPLSASSFR
jgi:hypothetical protein